MIAMKIGMKEDTGVADKMTLSNFGLCDLDVILRKVRTYLQFIMAGRVSGSTRDYALSAPQCTYLQFMLLEGKDCD